MISALTCLAVAVYFEARGEPLAGQLAVAQVVLNRVVSEKYPDNICDVITQGPTHGGEPVLHMCQFSFYCDGRPEDITDEEAWATSKNVANAALVSPLDVSDGATLYHAVTVFPEWRNRMQVTVRLGQHIFYKQEN